MNVNQEPPIIRWLFLVIMRGKREFSVLSPKLKQLELFNFKQTFMVIESPTRASHLVFASIK